MRKCFLQLFLLLAPTCVLAQYKVMVVLENTTAYEGRTLAIRMYDYEQKEEAVRITSLPLDGGTYARELVGVVYGRSYDVDLFIDVNGNGIYDAPPVDAAWRMTLRGVTGDDTVYFRTEDPMDDVEFPNVSTAQLHHVSKTYVGSWKNLTYNTTGPATGSSIVDFGQRKANLSMTTNGAFGIPAPLTLNFTGTVHNSGDSIYLEPAIPAFGNLQFVRGELVGVVTLQSPQVSLYLYGHYGEHQLMFTYSMAGAFDAQGIMTMTQATATGVDSWTSNGVAQPNPSQSQTLLRSESPFTRVEVYDLMGSLLRNAAFEETSEYALDVRDLTPGVYLARMHGRTSTCQVNVVVR